MPSSYNLERNYAAAIQGAMFELAEVLVLQGKLPQATQTYQELIKAIDPLPPLTVEALLGLAGFFEGNVQVNGNFAATGTKAFVQAHPTDPSREIVYVALEGGEAGTYMRGTGQLQSGKAVLALPEHFGLVTATEGLTIQLTPRGEWLHLYLVELDTAQLVVREAQGKSRAFDYLIHGVRRGYEQHEVLRMKR